MENKSAHGSCFMPLSIGTKMMSRISCLKIHGQPLKLSTKFDGGHNHVWVFKATPAAAQMMPQKILVTCHYQNQDGSLYLTIGPAGPRSREQTQVEQLVAPKPSAAVSPEDLTVDSPRWKSQQPQKHEEISWEGRRDKERTIDPDKALWHNVLGGSLWITSAQVTAPVAVSPIHSAMPRARHWKVNLWFAKPVSFGCWQLAS